MGRRKRKSRRSAPPTRQTLPTGRRTFCSYTNEMLDSPIRRAKQQISKKQVKDMNKVLSVWRRWQRAGSEPESEWNMLLPNGSVTMVELIRFVTYCLHDYGKLPRYKLTSEFNVYFLLCMYIFMCLCFYAFM